MQRKIRVLVGKPGLDGHDRGAKVVAAALRDSGMEVIYTGLHQTPEQIVEAALQEDADVVALSILSGAHMTLFEEVQALMKRRGLEDRLLTGGGIIPPEDMEALAKRGVGRLFGPGASTQEIADYIRGWFVARHGAGALAPAVKLAPAAARATRETARRDAAEARHHETAAKAGAKPAARKRAPARASRSAPAGASARKSERRRSTAKRKRPALRGA